MLREVTEDDLHALCELYLDLHETELPEFSPQLRAVWQQILCDENHHIIVNVIDGKIVSSCVCVIILNLTRGVRPYALIENVVTGSKYRGRGYATACLEFAREIAVKNNCYKMMLMTGSKEEKTLEFYKNAGFNGDDKKAFIQWI